MNIFEEFDKFSYIRKLDNNFDITVWDSYDVSKIVGIQNNHLDILIGRTGKKCADIGWKYSYNIDFIKETGHWTITTIGMYQLLELSSSLKHTHILNSLSLIFLI